MTAEIDPVKVSRDLPAEFEEWWGAYRHKTRDLAGYSVKKQIGFDAYAAGVAARAMQAATPAPAGVGVKALVWLSPIKPFFAVTPFCNYRIDSVEDDTGPHWQTTISYQGSMYRRHETESEAKAAAQADYAARILSALEPAGTQEGAGHIYYCTDCESSFDELNGDRCGCGSGRVMYAACLTPAPGADVAGLVERLRTGFFACPTANEIDRAQSDMAEAADRIEALEAEVERKDKGFPRLTDAMIRAACKAHYGDDNIDGIGMTADDRDWSFEQAFKRMWSGARRAALAPAKAGG
jgi:hypothetical protein